MLFEYFQIRNHDQRQALKSFELALFGGLFLAALVIVRVLKKIEHDQIFILFQPTISDLLLFADNLFILILLNIFRPNFL